MGASGFGYQLAKQFKHTVLPTCASLVPFTLSGKTQDRVASLSGISVTATIENPRTGFTGELLFTHRGLSGPAVLQLSNYWNLGEAITINFLPNDTLRECIAEWKKTSGKLLIKNLLMQLLPKRFVNSWLPQALQNKTAADLNQKDTESLHNCFQQWSVIPSGTEGYRTAEVTRGGINTDEVSSKTFESKNVQGLYFVGEVLDVTGWLGGYNFQWAWASGWCAGQVV
jgi:Predicted flavoproteins